MFCSGYFQYVRKRKNTQHDGARSLTGSLLLSEMNTDDEACMMSFLSVVFHHIQQIHRSWREAGVSKVEEEEEEEIYKVVLG